MKTPVTASRLFCITLLTGLGLQAQNLAVTGNLSATGTLDIEGNTASFGTEGTTDAGYILEYVPATDTVQFNATSSAATWLWRQGLTSPQMQLSGNNLLTLFRSGSAAGVVLNPASVNGTANEFIRLQSTGNVDGTAQRIAGYSDVRNGYIDFKRFAASGPVTGLVLGTFGGDAVTIRSTGAGDPGSVGIGTSNPSVGVKLEVAGNLKVTGGTITTPSVTLPDGSTLTTARTNTLYNAAGTAVASVATDGKVNFINGLSVGSGGSPATITPNSAAYMNQTLANLGYREGVTATPMKTIPTTGQVTINAITQDASFIYVAGTCSGEGSIGSTGFWVNTNLASAFVAKLNLVGVAQWVKTVSGGTNVNFRAITVDGSGNVVAAGSFSGTTTGLSSPASNLTSNGSNSDALVVKYNSSGASQWAQRVGGINQDAFSSVAVDGSGNVVASGFFTNTTTGLSSPANNLTSNGSNLDALVVKYNSSGASQWAQRVGGTSGDAFYSVSVDSSGNVIAAGYLAGTTTGLSSPASNLTSNGIHPDALVVKYNASGASQWAQRAGGPNGDIFNSVAVDSSGNVVAAGYLAGTTTGLSSPAGNVTSNGALPDALVVKYNAAGASQWAQRVGGTNQDSFHSVAVDGSGNVVAVGYFTGTTTGLGNPANNLTANGSSRDAFVVKYNASGASQTADKISGIADDYAMSISMLGNSIWLAGNTSNSSAMFGDSRVIGSFALGWSNLPVVTPTAGAPATLAWGGSGASNTGVALGSSAFASAQGSAAFGSSSATAQNAFSAGSASATGIGAAAMGVESLATGHGATAMGAYVEATGSGATAMGTYTTATGYGATAMGLNSSASGLAATAIGSNAYATNLASTAMGSETGATGYASVAMGLNLLSQSYASTVVGSLNISQGNPNDWVETDDIFVIGNGDSINEWIPRNALAVHKNGNARVRGTVQAKGGFRTPPMGDIGMGDFMAGPTPAGQTTDGSSDPANLGDGLRFPGE